MSAPTIDFQTVQSSGELEVPVDNSVPSGDEGKFLLEDLKEVDYRGRETVGRGQETARVPDTIRDPFTGSRVKVIKSVPRKGETVASSRLVVDLDRISR